MGDCSIPQTKRLGGRAANPSAEKEPEEAEPLSEQAAAQAQARQAQLEGRDSIVHFLRRKATGSPEWGRKHLRSHAAEDSRTSTEEQIPAQGTSSPDISTDTDSPTEGVRAHRSLSCPALLTTGHHDLADYDDYDASLSQARAAPLEPLTSVFSTIEDTAFQCFNSAVDCLPRVVSPQASLYKDLFVTADPANQHANKSEEHKPTTKNVTTIAQVTGEFEWSPAQAVQAEQMETVNLPELSPCGKSTILPVAKGRSSITDQELGALCEQFLNNLEEQINRTLSLTTTVTATATATKHYEKDEDGDGPSVITIHECPTNAQELAAIRASQDIMARALICQSKQDGAPTGPISVAGHISAGCQNKGNKYREAPCYYNKGISMSILSDP
ncbi:hypothetical protein NDU88_000558 [Pleurodeles waltl]|uniref:Uncharacterized protein n=1 Tax=Pleurodeles waltl TaxID=8319 RepID=A0AAV7S4Y2_PLEWA|nr:hypothetical protein NDU88_000558 [Pleurodeles waltl]